jgi:hypothetical protein
MKSWPALLLAPSLVLLDQSVVYMLAGWSCASQNQGIAHAVHAAFLVAVLATLIPSWRWHRLANTGSTRIEGESRTRIAFSALIGLLVGILSAAVIVAMWIPQWVLSPCYG